MTNLDWSYLQIELFEKKKKGSNVERAVILKANSAAFKTLLTCHVSSDQFFPFYLAKL